MSRAGETRAVAGAADVFEGTFRLEVHAGGKLVSKRTVHATSGTGFH